MSSRSRKLKNTGVIAPSSSPKDPMNMRWLRMRFHSPMSTRIHCARSGTSSSMSFSTARATPSSLQNALSQSWRLVSAMIWR